MPAFDPTKPINDASVWKPQGMFVKQDTKDGKEEVFILAQEDMSALNRYVWTGKLLPTNRDEYKRSLGILDGTEISDNVWTAADQLLVSYTAISKDCGQFLDVTWSAILELANKIHFFASRAGGSESSSYYQNILTGVGNYNKEKESASPDQDKLDQIANYIRKLAQREIDRADELHKMAGDVKTELKSFHDSTKKTQGELNGSKEALDKLLVGQDGEIQKLKDDINDSLAKIKDELKKIDQDRYRRDAAYAYCWCTIIGTIVAAKVISDANADIDNLKESISKLQGTINQDKIKLQSAMALLGDINSMNDQFETLLSVTEPAITTIEKLQSAWNVMGTSLSDLSDLFENQTDEIPDMDLAQTDLDDIREEWNKLGDYADKYRQVAYISTDPPKQSLDDYAKELQQS